jgi:hypothetical protein
MLRPTVLLVLNGCGSIVSGSGIRRVKRMCNALQNRSERNRNAFVTVTPTRPDPTRINTGGHSSNGSKRLRPPLVSPTQPLGGR